MQQSKDIAAFRFREEAPPRFKFSYAAILSLLLLFILFLGVQNKDPFSLPPAELARLAQLEAEQKREMTFRFVDAPPDQVEVEDAKFLSDADRIEKSRQEDAPNQNNDPLSRGNTFELKNRNNQPESESPVGNPSPTIVSPPSPQQDVAENKPEDQAQEQETTDEARETPEEVEEIAENQALDPAEAGAGNAPLFEGGPKPFRRLTEAEKKRLASQASREMTSVNLSETMGKSVDAGSYDNPEGRNAPNIGLSVETNRSDMGEYLKILRQLVKGNWRIPAIARFEVSGVSGVSFNIHKDGRISDVVLIRASGYEPLDVSAMNAITATYKAPPLPDHVDEDPVPLKFAFYYNMRPRY